MAHTEDIAHELHGNEYFNRLLNDGYTGEQAFDIMSHETSLAEQQMINELMPEEFVVVEQRPTGHANTSVPIEE